MKTLTQYQLEESILFIDEQSFASYIQSNYPKLLFTLFSTSIKDYTSTNQFDVSETTNHQLLAELTNTLPQYIDNYFLDTLFDTFNHEHDKAFNRLQKPSIAL